MSAYSSPPITYEESPSPPPHGLLGSIVVMVSPFIVSSVSMLVIAGSLFNVIAHSAIAISFFVAPESARAVWQRMAEGSVFESPGVGLYYLLACALPEAWSAMRFVIGAPEATKRLIAFQIFVLGGGGAYQSLILSSPHRGEHHLQQTLTFEWLFVAGLMIREDVGVPTLHDALKVYVGCKCAGFLWSWIVAGTLRACGLAKLAKEPKPRELAGPGQEEHERPGGLDGGESLAEARRREYLLLFVVIIVAAYLA